MNLGNAGYVEALLDEKKKEGLNPNLIAEEILAKAQIVYLNDNFYQYRDGVYKKSSQQEIDLLIKLEVGESFRSFLAKEVRNSLSTIATKKPEDFDQDPDILNCKNGLLKLSTLQLEPHRPDYLSLSQISASFFEGTPECPKWIRFLREILVDEELKANILQEFLGYSLTPSCRMEKALFLIGSGANGKSVFLDVLDGIFGTENKSSVGLDQLKNSHYTARLFGKMLNASYESETKAEVYEGQLKALISGEEVEADHKFGHPFQFRNKAKFIFALNSLPRVNDKTDAFYRRLLIVPFNVTIPEETRNINLAKEILSEERDQIFKWSLYGLARLRDQGFTKSKQVEEAISEYRVSNNNVLVFVNERCQLSPALQVRKSTLYEDYKDFCGESGYEALGEIKFGKQIREQFRQVTDDRITDGVRIWKGIDKK